MLVRGWTESPGSSLQHALPCDSRWVREHSARGAEPSGIPVEGRDGPKAAAAPRGTGSAQGRPTGHQTSARGHKDEARLALLHGNAHVSSCSIAPAGWMAPALVAVD